MNDRDLYLYAEAQEPIKESTDREFSEKVANIAFIGFVVLAFICLLAH